MSNNSLRRFGQPVAAEPNQQQQNRRDPPGDLYQDEMTRLTGGDNDDEADEILNYGASSTGGESSLDSQDDNPDEDGTLDAEAPAPNPQDGVADLTRRLRYTFACITWPILPLGVLVILALVYMLFASCVDWRASCSHPLHTFAIVSLVVVVYAPNHPFLRAYMFGYHRDINGPARPLAVRRYDQFIHTLALLYVYAAITLDLTCKADLNNNSSSSYAPDNAVTITDAAAVATNDTASDALDGALLSDTTSSTGPSMNSCQATCPHLYPAVEDYIITLKVLCWSVLLPLFCLPCIYLWFLHRAVGLPQSLDQMREQLRDDQDVLRNGNVLASTLMQDLKDIQLVRVVDEDDGNANDNDSSTGRILIVPVGSTNWVLDGKDSNDVKECCICMNDFVVLESYDVETGDATALLVETDDAIAQTKKCSHIFHKRCIASWVGGRWQGGSPGAENDATTRRARRTTCPLCRNDLRPNS